MGIDSPTGGIIGGFRVLEPIGRGAMGAVYLAEDAGGQRVALKLLSPELAHDERFRHRFLRESRLAAALDHPNVVRTIAAGEGDGVLYLAMEYVDGVDLRALLHREERLEPERAVALVSQVAAALDAAHAAGLVHRDVKPGNVLVAGELAYVCDFGLARHVSSVGSLTGDRGFVGTVDYVAPEQIRGETVDGRADVYALGCVLFECLTGERPFERESELAIVFAHLNEPPRRLTDARPELPSAWDGVIARALAKDPDGRYPTCAALASAADEALHGRAAPRRRSRWLLAGVVAAAIGIAAAAIGAALAVRDDSPTAKRAAAAPLVLNAVDTTTARSLASIRSGTTFGYEHAPTDVVVAGHSAWLLLPADQRVLRVDTRTHELEASIRLPWMPLDRLAAADGYVWAAQDGGPDLARIDIASGRVDRFAPENAPSRGIAAGDGLLWVATDAEIGRVVPGNGTTGNHLPYRGNGRLTVGAGAVWSLEDFGLLRKLDPESGRELARIDLHATVSDVAIGGGLVWAAVVPDGVVYGLDPESLKVRRRLAAGRDPERISFADGRLWVANTAARAISSLDPVSGKRKQLPLAAMPTSIAFHGGVAWAGSVPEPPPLPPAGGPELRVALPGDYLTLDPAASHSTGDVQLEQATCANLLAYGDTPGPGRMRLRPEAAVAMPQVSPDGRTYTFRIRPGFRFSPPSNEAVTAATFKHTLERVFSPKMGRGGRGPSDAPAVVGLPRFFAGKAAHVSGIKARGDVLSITLERPSGDFAARISLQHLCPVPLTTPIRQLPADRALPSSGPYSIASVADGRVVLLPNPNYGGHRPRHWARIVYTLGVPTPEAVSLVDHGKLDYLPLDFGGASLLSRHGVLERRYGPGSAAAVHGDQRFFPTIGRFLDYMVLNAGRPLFRDVRMRRAVEYALDRRKLALAFHDDPDDQIVAPSVEGFPPGAVYPVHGRDLATARRLAGDRPRSAVLSYCTFFPFGDEGEGPVAALVKGELARIGIDVRIVRTDECPQPYVPGVKSDLLLVTTFGSDVSDPIDYLDMALASGHYGSALGPGLWSTASFRRRFEAARGLRGGARTREYVRLEHELMQAAPFAVYGSYSGGQYLSPRVRCEAITGAAGVFDLLELCPRRA